MSPSKKAPRKKIQKKTRKKSAVRPKQNEFDSETDKLVLKLYVTGTTPRSTQALLNLKRICEKHLNGRYDLEVIDVYQKPELAKEEQIIAAPTLVKILPLPIRRLIGDMSDENKVLVGLSIQPLETASNEPARKSGKGG